MFDRTGHEQIEHGRQNNFNLTSLHYGMFSYRYGWEGWVTSNNKGQLYDSTVASGNVLNCLLHGWCYHFAVNRWVAHIVVVMLRSAFRGKQPADSTAKEEKHASSEHGKSHFFFHHDHHHEEQDRKDQITNINDDAIADGELYIDCNQEFLSLEESSNSERESRNEANGSRGKITSEESFPANSGPIPKNVGGAGTNDCPKESFSNSERQIYEMQLAQLQEQLVNTMIDHQELSK